MIGQIMVNPISDLSCPTCRCIGPDMALPILAVAYVHLPINRLDMAHREKKCSWTRPRLCPGPELSSVPTLTLTIAVHQ